MMIIPERLVARGPRARRVGHRPFLNALLIPVVLFPLGLGALAVRSALHELSPWIVIPLSILVSPLALILLLAAEGLWRSFLAGFSSRNWLLQTDDSGLWIKFRSYLNDQFDSSDPVVVYLSWAEIAQVRRVIRHVRLRNGGSERGEDYIDRQSVLELTLSGAKTDALEKALATERARKAPETRFLGVSSRSRFDHSPVRVPDSGVIEVEWLGRRAMSLFEGRTNVAPILRKGDGANERDVTDDDILAATERGEIITAVRLARTRYGMGLAQAKRFVEELRGEAPLERSTNQNERAALDLEVLNLARSGERLKAVRLVHDRYGLGLMDARILVDSLRTSSIDATKPHR